MRTILLLTLLVAAAGCTETIYITRPLPLPERPVLPRIYEVELICVSDDTYKAWVERERLRREYAERLEAIICSTHDPDTAPERCP